MDRRMIIDCHGHFTTAPASLAGRWPDGASPWQRADQHMARVEVYNDLIGRVCGVFVDNFAAVCQLPQSLARRSRTA
jgi:hypothetical protein